MEKNPILIVEISDNNTDKTLLLLLSQFLKTHCACSLSCSQSVHSRVMIVVQAAVNLLHQHPSHKVIKYISIIWCIRNKVIVIEFCHKINNLENKCLGFTSVFTVFGSWRPLRFDNILYWWQYLLIRDQVQCMSFSSYTIYRFLH